MLLEDLAKAASTRGIHAFVAENVTENHEMLRAFSDAGFRVTTTSEAGASTVRLRANHRRVRRRPIGSALGQRAT